MQGGAHPIGPFHRHDPHCTSYNQRPVPSISADLSRGAEPSVPSGKGGLQNTPEKQQQQLHQQQPPQLWQQLPQSQQQEQQGSATMPSVSAGSPTTDVPILSFEIDDAEGPLEGASNGLASQFGRLKVILLLKREEDAWGEEGAGRGQEGCRRS